MAAPSGNPLILNLPAHLSFLANRQYRHETYLPDEFIEEILSRVPVETLLQLQGVCKSWKTLIAQPRFAKKHLRNSPKVTRLILYSSHCGEDFVFRFYSLPKVINSPYYSSLHFTLPKRIDWLVGSCHGILCFAKRERPGREVLWNPSINKAKKLPPLSFQNCEKSYSIFTVYGFGHDLFSDTYKVVAIHCNHNGDCITEVKILTLGTDSWRTIQDFPAVIPCRHSYGEFVSGSLNWLIRNDSSSSSSSSSSSFVIVCLDLRTESFGEVLQPDYEDKEDVEMCSLHVLRDCLCILPRTDTFIDVWLMTDYGNTDSWTKLFRVFCVYGYGPFPYTDVQYISDDDRVLLKVEGLVELSQFIVYDSRNATLSDPVIQINDDGDPTSMIYLDSLISPAWY